MEIFQLSALERLSGQTQDPEDREHVTRGFYSRSSLYRIKNVQNPRGDQSSLSDVLDTPEDWDKIQGRFDATS